MVQEYRPKNGTTVGTQYPKQYLAVSATHPITRYACGSAMHRLGMRENPFMTRFVLQCLAFALLVPGLRSSSQVVPPVTMSPFGGIFAQGAVAHVTSSVDPAQYGNLLYGGSIGTYFQIRPLLGIDARAFGLASRSQTGHDEHQRALFAGPRFAFRHKRLRMYGVTLGGISHGDYVGSLATKYPNGQDVLSAATEPALQVGGGADLLLNRRVLWRMGEVTYNHMFIPLPSGAVVPNGLSGPVFSTGLALQIFH
jgi:hypothetical protein